MPCVYHFKDSVQSDMWKWDQGRLSYFEFDNVRNMARAATQMDLRQASHAQISDITGLPFSPNDPSYKPWRNYARIFKLMRLVSEQEGGVVASPVAEVLAADGAVTSDEFIHYIACSHTDPSPALDRTLWLNADRLRWPLLFSIKYCLAVRVIDPSRICGINEILTAYASCDFTGDEDQNSFAELILNSNGNLIPQKSDAVRQGRESLKFLSQLSYLMMPDRSHIVVNLSEEDAHDTFLQLTAIPVNVNTEPAQELLRLSELFRDGSDLEFDFNRVEKQSIIDSGFREGTKSEKTHLVTERNSQLRKKYFDLHPISHCDLCTLDTHATYQWTERVLDLHHVLPLASGTRVDNQTGTIFDDLRPVCPTCHRAIHSYYSNYLRSSARKDFSNRSEAYSVYEQIKHEFVDLRLYP